MPTTVMATALPYSLAKDAPFQVSVFFTHKLTGDGATLADYPSALNWVDVLAAARLTLTIGGTSAALQVVSAPDSSAWRSLLPGSVPVAPFPAPQLAASTIRSNPASRMSEHAIDVTLAAINASPGLRPRVWGTPLAEAVITTIAGLDPNGPVTGLLHRARRRGDQALLARRVADALATIGPLDGVAIGRERGHEPPHEVQPLAPDSALDGILGDLDADRRVSAALDGLLGKDLTGQPELRLLADAHAMGRYYEPGPGASAAGPRPEPPQHDFHARVASFGSTPALLRALGLVVDVTLADQAAMQALTQATEIGVVLEGMPDDVEVIPARPTKVEVDGEAFRAASSPAWTRGALPLGEPDWVLLDTDPDAGGLKLEQYLRDLPRQLASELNGDAATAAPATIRSTGFAIARTNRADVARQRLRTAEALPTDGRSLLLDDVVRGYRLEVWDDATSTWHSLHRRRVDVTAPDGATVLSDTPDVGFLQASGLNRRDGSDDLYLHEVIAGWDGWSLSAPRPGLTAERVTDPAPGEPTERMVETPSDAPLDGARVVSRVEPGSLPRLRYGTSYSFRVLAVDLAGNSYPVVEPAPVVEPLPPEQLPGHLKRLRDQFERLDRGGVADKLRRSRPARAADGIDVDDLRRALGTGDRDIDAITGVLFGAVGPVTAARERAIVLPQVPGDRPIRVRPNLDELGRKLKRRIPGRHPVDDPPADEPEPPGAPPDPRVTVTLPRPYLRWEPVGSPVVVARSELDPGEQLAVLVVRSGPGERDRSERHLAPPKATQFEAETVGLFDAAIGTGDAAEIRRLYAVALAERGTLLDSHRPSLTDPNVLTEQPQMRLASRPGADPAQPSLDDLAADRGRPFAEGQYVVHDVDQLTLPYLPEPFADGASLVFYHAGEEHLLDDPNALQVLRLPYPGVWPSREPLRLVLERGDAFDARADGNAVRVTLPPGEQYRATLASTLPQDALKLFGLWRSILAGSVDESDGYTTDELTTLVRLQRAATSGWLWWLTPGTPLRLVHAVPAPAQVPQLRDLRILARPKDRGVVALAGVVEVHGPSTDQLVVRADWTERRDDPTQPAPETVTRSDIVVRSGVPENERTGLLHLIDWSDPSGAGLAIHRAIQNFPDTHRRVVTYHPGGTTRYAEYFAPDELPATPGTGDPVTLDIPSSARPAAPTVLDTVPLLRWDDEAEPATPFGWLRTRGSGVRVWLDRPWFSSGDGELLGVVVFDPTHSVREAGAWVSRPNTPEPPDEATSLWAVDPIQQRGGRTSGATVPPLLGREHVLLDTLSALWAGPLGITPPVIGGSADGWPRGAGLPVAASPELVLRDIHGSPTVRVIGYEPEYDPETRRWFVDIALQNAPVASPFLRLAVVRWQPNSLPGCEVSGVAVTGWTQPLPERRLSVSRPDAATVQVTVSGVTARLRPGTDVRELPGGLIGPDAPTGEEAAAAARLLRSRTMLARLEQRPDGAGDLDWSPVAYANLVPVHVDEGGTQEATWAGTIRIPDATPIDLRRPGGPESTWRVVVEEQELLDADSTDGMERLIGRLVYADHVAV